MSCVAFTVPALPSLGPISLPGLSLGLPTLTLSLCCQFQLPLPSIVIPPIPLPVAIITAINADIAILNAYLSVLDFTFDCPFN